MLTVLFHGIRAAYHSVLSPLPSMNPFPGPRSILMLDNCAIYKGDAVREAVEASGKQNCHFHCKHALGYLRTRFLICRGRPAVHVHFIYLISVPIWFEVSLTNNYVILQDVPGQLLFADSDPPFASSSNHESNSRAVIYLAPRAQNTPANTPLSSGFNYRMIEELVKATL
jgi:hypothetical protein